VGFSARRLEASTPESDLRRATLSPFFSKLSIRRIEPILQDALRKFLDRLATHAKSDILTRTNLLFIAATSDVISESEFKQCRNSLRKDDLSEEFFAVLSDTPKLCHVVSYFPALGAIFTGMPAGTAPPF